MKRTALIAAAGIALLVTGCTTSSGSDSSESATAGSRAVVIVSGGGATTPFTTPTEACSSEEGFLTAGNTATGLRDYLLAQGKQVYTAPTNADWGEVVDPDPTSFGPFKDCAITLPESLTIMSAADIDLGGERLARFIDHLNSEYGVTEVDLVGHSNGGLWSRAAIKVLQWTDSPVAVKSLTTLGTPHEGSVPGRYQWGEIGIDACMGNSFCEQFNNAWVPYANIGDKGINREDTEKYLNGPTGWNLAQGNVLDAIPVTLIGGAAFEEPGGSPVDWPYDGVVSVFSAWAQSVPDAIMPHRTCWQGPLTHSIFVTEAYNQMMKPTPPWDWQTAMTWNTDALARVNQAIDESGTALEQPTREGC